LSGSVGGYNFDPNAYRGAAFASCEHWGQSMFLNYTSPNNGPNLYQVVLIGEQGSGNVQFMMKDDFENASLMLSPIAVFPDSPTVLNVTSSEGSTILETAQLSYTTDNWVDSSTINMNIDNQTCNATIPGQPAGTLVQYEINATDLLENCLYLSGNFTVENATLVPLTALPSEIYPNNPTDIAYTTNGTILSIAQLSYTTDNWVDTNTINMNIDNQTCNATIPGQAAGTLVQYRINATDLLENGLNASGNYTVRQPFLLSISAAKSKIRLGGKITIDGFLTLNSNNSVADVSSGNSTTNSASNSTKAMDATNSSISMGPPDYNDSVGEVQFTSLTSSQTVDCLVSNNGTFVATFQPDASGVWIVTATSPETQVSYGCYSHQLTITVTPVPPYTKYSLFILAGFIIVLAAAGIVYVLKFRGTNEFER
jgi:hypothetical protein